MSTGPLGQGFASAVGMALAGKIQKCLTEFPSDKKWGKRSLIDYNVYVLCGDGDLMEGITYEAASLAGTWKLNNLIVLYDSNNMSLDGTTNNTFTENISSRMQALGWDTFYVKNGNDLKSLNKTIDKAKMSSKPAFIEVKTILGEGSLLANTNKVHGTPLTTADITQLKGHLGIPDTDFYVYEEARNYLKKQLMTRISSKYNKWATNYQDFIKGEMNPYKERYYWLFGKKQEVNLNKVQFDFEVGMKEATRVTNQTIMEEISKYIPNFIGGSADLFSSTKAYINGGGDLNPSDYTGKNIWFGIREHAMGAIVNGMALCNFSPFVSTFLSFSDYLKPAIRMSSLMHLPVTYIFSHDSISVGEDGPTHQPIEQLAMLRSIPNLSVFRPCDAHELVGSWNYILNHQDNPYALVLSRSDVPLLNETNANYVPYGAYMIRQEIDNLDGVLIATGTEVNMAYHLAYELYKNNRIDLRVVSMPCMELFLKTPSTYQEQLLPNNKLKVIIEAGSSNSFSKIMRDKTKLICIDSFGYSGSKESISKALNFDHISIKNKIINWISEEKSAN